MPADTDDLTGRDYDVTRLTHFEDGPSDDIAADLATLLGKTATTGPATAQADPQTAAPAARTASGDAGVGEGSVGEGSTRNSRPARRRSEADDASATPAAAGRSGASSGGTDGSRVGVTRRARGTGSASRARRTSGTDGDPGEHVSRILYLPADLVEALRIYRATTLGVSNTQIALSALNAHYLEVDHLVDAVAGARVSHGALFDEVVNERQIPKRQVEITPTRAQLRIIDDIVESSRAKDRSQLFTVVIQRWLADRAGADHA